MKITRAEEQGLRLAITLARCGGQANLAALARMENLSEALVAKVLGQLRRGGVVVAFRGRNGRYELAAPPDETDVLTVLRAFGRPLLQGCADRDGRTDANPCPHVTDCGLRSVWNHLEGQVSRVLRGISLADLIRDQDDVRRQVAALVARDADEDFNPDAGPRDRAGLDA